MYWGDLGFTFLNFIENSDEISVSIKVRNLMIREVSACYTNEITQWFKGLVCGQIESVFVSKFGPASLAF
jgi:hypothetical protein